MNMKIGSRFINYGVRQDNIVPFNVDKREDYKTIDAKVILDSKPIRKDGFFNQNSHYLGPTAPTYVGLTGGGFFAIKDNPLEEGLKDFFRVNPIRQSSSSGDRRDGDDISKKIQEQKAQLGYAKKLNYDVPEFTIRV